MLGVRLRARREELGLTLEELAQDIGVHWTQLQRWETDKAMPNGKALRELGKRLKISVDYLFK